MLFSYKKVNDKPAVYKVNNKEVSKEEYDKAWEHRFDELDRPSEKPEFKPLEDDGFKPFGTTTDGNDVYYKPVEPESKEKSYSLEEQIIDQFVEDCFNDKTDYYVDMVYLDCGMVIMSIIRKDTPKYVSTMVFDNICEAAQFCFDVMNGKAEFIPEINLDKEAANPTEEKKEEEKK